MYDVAFIKDTLLAAGNLALEYYLKVTPAWKDDRTYLTDADLAVQEYVREALDRQYPDDGIVAEENGLRKAPKSGVRYWVVDPIDGTASFAAGLPVWGIVIALIEGDEPVGGFFYQPVTRDLFYTTPDGQVFRNDRPRHLREPEAFHRETSLFIASRLHRYYTLSPDYPGKLRNLASSMAHLAYLATGSADAALVERVYIWDIAAGMAMLKLNGGVWQYVNGEAVSLSALLAGQQMPYPMLAGRPHMVAAFQGVIAYNGGE